MFGLIKETFISAMTFFCFTVLNMNYLECISMNNQECKIRSEIINLNTDEPMFYPYSIKMNKYKGSLIRSMNHMLNYVFLTTLKTQMSKYLI